MQTSVGQPWLGEIARLRKEAAELLGRSEAEQRKSGYFHTLHEILQQPSTWLHTGKQLVSNAANLCDAIAPIKGLIFTGSGSSEYAGECVRLTLQKKLSIPVQVVGGGALLAYGSKAIPPGRPGLMVSLARSGDSPESVGAVSVILEQEPEINHLIVTCNRSGQLATTFRGNSRVSVVLLPEQTNDRSLVMTSSFTNLVLAAMFLGMLQTPAEYLALTECLSRKAEELLQVHFDTLADAGRREFNRVVFLASGPRLGAARESALKMLEMTAGRVYANCETYLGLRHGPMSAVHSDTLVVCLLSSDPLVRAYECDLIRELNDKRLGMAKIVFGENIPQDLKRSGDVFIESAGLAEIGDENMPALDMLLGQLLAFFRCLNDGLEPDSPSSNGVIHRVVQSFRLHRPAGKAECAIPV